MIELKLIEVLRSSSLIRLTSIRLTLTPFYTLSAASIHKMTCRWGRKEKMAWWFNTSWKESGKHILFIKFFFKKFEKFLEQLLINYKILISVGIAIIIVAEVKYKIILGRIASTNIHCHSEATYVSFRANFSCLRNKTPEAAQSIYWIKLVNSGWADWRKTFLEIQYCSVWKT